MEENYYQTEKKTKKIKSGGNDVKDDSKDGRKEERKDDILVVEK